MGFQHELNAVSRHGTSASRPTLEYNTRTFNYGAALVCLHQRDLEIEADGRVLAELKAKGFVESYPLRMSQLPLKHQTAKDGFQLTDRGWRIAFE